MCQHGLCVNLHGGWIMNDLEICRSIAEIEGFKYLIECDGSFLAFNMGNNNSVTNETVYNPLTDAALCRKLIISNGLQRVYFQGKGWFYTDQFADIESVSINTHGENRAACLAIIEANK